MTSNKEFVYPKFIDGDIIFFMESNVTQKQLLEELSVNLDKLSNFFSEGDGFYVLIKNPEMYSIVPKIGKIAKEKKLQLLGAYFEDLPEVKKKKKEFRLSATNIYKKHVRSGQILDNPGDIIIFGNVNQGAEIRAGGSVIVFGKVKGTVRVGMTQKKNTFIVAAEMDSPLVEISGIVLNNYAWPQGPVSIHYDDDQISVEPIEL
ncbi:semialdehyde dehydrogenase [Marinitoga sp. 1135]|uniref:Probable septum site-determining protein MinC n=1 Tax=Marinitoga piezophila (strain DSM 14283 / JCM 11233 / KA3) TaxID=443254 RepID=H2J688_MARPK|nr:MULTISPECIES: septum site-determining protein MinC [Marinitoga]AEX86236.1 septum formation inhibitor [Marinitoga piezophila KA3]APT76647.1 semialdehyde dehydrogenase [Marinitoga sp. 1137]NUU96421.1 semialdehyde dehydrogenase [Marinitoga sp. 1135]NUU98342.1 semialdehyde dehydrogenase [Marinitoga sp. 1138]